MKKINAYVSLGNFSKSAGKAEDQGLPKKGKSGLTKR
jgi:hypothetical protein